MRAFLRVLKSYRVKFQALFSDKKDEDNKIVVYFGNVINTLIVQAKATFLFSTPLFYFLRFLRKTRTYTGFCSFNKKQ